MEGDVLSCKNLSEHKDKWILLTVNEKAEIHPCFACCILSLEDKQQLSLYKSMILSYIRNLMTSNTQVLINVVASNDQVVFHSVQVFLNLLNCCDERLIKLSGECLLLFLIHLKKEGLVLSVMQRLTVEIEEYSNHTKSLSHYHILGRLFQLFPDIVMKGECNKSKFLHMLANGLNYPSDDVKSAILFLLRQIYQNTEKNKIAPRSLDAIFAKNVLRIIKHTQSKHLLKISLGLLQIFITKVLQSFSILFENSPDEISFIDVVKKLILSNEREFQICIVQCICQLLSNSLVNKYITLLLEANIPEILFDALSTRNELLLESILCCLQLFVHWKPDVAKSRFVFGVGIITDISCYLLDLRNWRLLCTSLNLLTSIISSNQYLMTSSHITYFYQSIMLTEKAFNVQNLTVFLATCKFFTEFLKNKTLPWSLPLEQIHNNINLCLKALSNIISSLTVSEQINAHFGASKPLPLELKILICTLDIISSCVSLCKHYGVNLVSVEDGFACPNVKNVSTSFDNDSSTQPLILLCLSSIDEIFVPCCLQLKSSDIGKIAWYHLVQVLAVMYKEIQDNDLIYQLGKKLISVGIFKQLFDMKVSKMPFNECTAEEVKHICNECAQGLLKCILKNEKLSEAYQKALENGIINLNGSFEDCAIVLSQKSDVETAGSNELCALSSQIAFLSLCYISYLNEAFVVNIKILVPHLVYFITCNSDFLSACTVLLKHVAFLMAVCSYECINRKLKFQTGLMEANMIIWDMLSKLKSPLQIYTHHKYMLWWCFNNETQNSFSSDVLVTWLRFCIDDKQSLRYYAMKTVIYLLSCSHTARQTFVFLFDISSSINNEAVILFLKEAYELEIVSDLNKEKLEDLIILMINHLHSFLIKLFIMKNENNKDLDRILYQGLDCLLWCHKQMDSIEIDTKILYHVSKYCFLASCDVLETIVACINFLQFALKHDKHYEKAWHVMTGDINFSSFFYKCFTAHSQLEAESLHLLVTLFTCQVNYGLKCNVYVKISPNIILNWLNSSKTQGLAYDLLYLIIKSEFQDDLLLSTHLECEVSFKNQQYLYYRLFSLYLLNAIVIGNPAFHEEAINGYLKFLNIVGKTDKHLEKHIMHQPWIKILMETRLEKIDTVTCKLFEKWFSLNNMNSTLIGVIQQFANKVQNINPLTVEQRHCIYKLCTGIYAGCLSKETRETLKQLTVEGHETNEEENNLVTQVQNVVTNYLSNIE